MKKAIGITIFTAVLSSSLYANTGDITLYAGGLSSLAHPKLDYNLIQDNTSTTIAQQQLAQNFSDTKFALGLVAGIHYGIMPNLNIGLETSYQWFKQKVSHTGNIRVPGVPLAIAYPAASTHQIENLWDFAFVLSTNYEKFLNPYVKLGVAYTELQSNLLTGIGSALNPHIEFQADKNISGTVLGVGIQKSFYEKFSVFLEYNYYHFSKRDMISGDTTSAITGFSVPLHYNIKIKPSIHSVRLGGKVNFDFI